MSVILINSYSLGRKNSARVEEADFAVDLLIYQKKRYIKMICAFPSRRKEPSLMPELRSPELWLGERKRQLQPATQQDHQQGLSFKDRRAQGAARSESVCGVCAVFPVLVRY